MRAKAFRVPGEHLPWPIPAMMLLASITTAGAASAAWHADAPAAAAPGGSAGVPPASPPAPAPAPAPAPSPSPSPAPPPHDEAVRPTASAAPAACARLVVGFALASATPPRQADASLAPLAAWLVANPDAIAILEGHADAVGHDESNLVLSRTRANQIAAILVKRGVVRSRLTTRGLGAFSPVEGEPDAAAVNRRVVIQVRGGAGCPLDREEVVGP